MTEPWATAHVDAELNWGDLDQEIVRRLTRSTEIAQRAASRNFEKLAGNAKRSFAKIGNAYDVEMKRIERRTATGVGTINRHLSRIESVTADVNLRMTGASPEQINAAASALKRLKRDAGNIQATINITINSIEEVERLNTALGRIARRYPVNVPVNVDRKGSAALSSLSFGLGGIGKKALSAGAMIGKFAGIAGAAVVAAGSLVPVIAAIGAGLYAIGGAAGTVAIGGLFAVGIAAAALKTAFSGVSDVMENMFDPEKADEFEKALAKLTPAAQSTMRAVQSLGKSYGEMVKKPVQEAMFAGLAPKIAKLSAFLPSVRDSLVGVADGFNDGANGALRMIESARGMTMVKSLLADAGNMGANFGAAITGAIPGFVALGASATHVLSPMTNAIGGMGHKWSESMMKMQADGTLEKKMRGFLDVARQVGTAFLTLGDIIGGVFRAAAAAGDGNPLGNIQGSLDTVSSWVNGPGQSALTSFFESAGKATAAILPVFLTLGEVIGTTVAPMIAQLAVAIGPVIEMVAGALGDGLAALAPAVAPLASAVGAIGTAIAPVLPALGSLISQFIQLAGPIVGALAGALGPLLQTLITALGPILQSLGTSLMSVLNAILPAFAPLGQVLASLSPVLAAIATVIGQVLAGAVTALMPLLTAVAGYFSQLMPVVTPLITMLGTVFTSVLSALAPVIATVADVLTQVGAVLAGALGTAIQAIMPLFEAMAPIFGQIAAVLGEFAGMLGGILVDAVTMLAPLLPLIVDAFSQLLQAVMPLVPILLELVSAALQPVLAVLPALIGIIVALVPVILQLVNVFSSILSAIVPVIGILAKLIGLFMSVLATIISFAAQAIAVVVGFVSGIVSTFLGMVSSVIGTIAGWVSTILGFFGDLVGKATSFVTDMWTTVSSSFSDGVGKAVGFVGELPGKIMDALSGAGKWLVDVGKNIIGGLIDGIKSMAGAIVEALVGLLPSALQGVARRALGLFVGGFVPALATGGVVSYLASGGRTKLQPNTATTRTAPGSYIVNAAATRRNRGLLKQVAPRGRVIRGPGTGVSDSIDGMYGGRTLARLSNGEFQVPPDEVGPILPLLQAMNAGQKVGQVAAHAAGGWVQGLAGGGSVGGREPYGLPAGTNTGGFGSSGNIFPAWVHGIEDKFNVKASTYAGHQESSGQNRGIDWVGSVSDMQKFAQYLLGIAPQLEQVIWKNPETGEQIGVADGKQVGPGTDQPGYYSADWDGHMDHVHTRQSQSFGGDVGPTKGIGDTPGGGSTSTPSGGGSTPIGSGIGSGGGAGGGAGGGSSWGNSGGGSKYNSAAEADRGGLTAVWVENWPSSMGGGGGGGVGTSPTTTGGIAPTGVPSGSGKDLKKGASKQEMMDAVYRIGKEKGMTDEQILAAGETLLAESDGKNYANSSVAGSTDRPHDAVGSDGKSLGVMQQQSGMGWGDDAQLMDPEYAIGRFYDEMKKTPSSGPAHTQAQAVQRSAFSDGSNYSAKEQEARDLLAKSKDNNVPVTPAGNVPVEVTNPTDTTTPPGDLSVPSTVTPDPTTTPDPTATPPGTTTPSTSTPGTTTPGTKAAYESMPFGTAKANSWAGSQDFGGQAQKIGLDALKEIGGEFTDPFGLTGAFDAGFDKLVAYLEEQRKNAPDVKFADVVNFNGGDPKEQKRNTTDGMTAVLETYRQG